VAPGVVPGVTVVICAHTLERLDDLRAAVASVQDQSQPADEILVVVDHNPALLAALEDLAPGVKVVASAGPKGLSGARNTGTGLATCEIVAYLDDDAAASRRWLEHLLAPYADASVVAVGGWAQAAWDTAQPAWFPDEFAWVVGCSHRGLPTTRTPVRNLIGCNMSFRRQAVLDAGGFDAGLGRTADRPLGCEETELCIRIRQQQPGAVILLEPAATIRHRVPASRTRWRYFVRRCRAEGTSKAHVSRLVGSGDALDSERTYVARILPMAVARAVKDLPRAPLANVARILAIVGGLAATTGGYLEHSIRHRT
jgi:GT2 family glycosyltransferase